MNELRMYVEHLFEGKVLTPETIELKEEIYGNLMARYEDYVAQGLSEADALARTKASITDVDDMMAGEGSAASAAEDALSSAPSTVIPPAAETVKMPTPDTAAQAAGAPVAPQASAPAPKEQPKWIKTLIIVAAVIIGLLAIGYGVNEFILDPIQDHQEDVAEAQAEQQWREQQSQKQDDASSPNTNTGGDTSTSNNSGTGQSTSGNQGTTPQFSDPEDQAEYEATMALMDDIWVNEVDLPREFAGTDVADDAKRSDLLGRLPLGEYLQSNSLANGTLSVAYQSVDHNIDGDALDLAMAYDVTTLFALYPSLNTVSVQVHENDDHASDVDRYQFDRQMVNSYLTQVSNNAITQANDSLFESQESWDQALDYMANERYFDDLTDRAEIDR